MADESGFIETDGARIYYEVDGSGEAVILLHAGIANLRMWDGQVEALRDGYRVIRYDLRGFGRTETDAVEFSNRADIAAVLDHLGERSAHVVGISRGAMIALDFVLEYPDRARSLVMAAGGIGGYQSPEAAPESTFEQVEKWWEAKEWEPLAEWETDYWVEGPGQPVGRADPDLRALVHDWILSNYRAEKEEGKPQPLDPPAVDRLSELRAPVLAMYGTLDEAGTSESMRHLAEVVPRTRLELFDGSAHMLNLEQPERFNRLLREFLDSVSATPPARG